MSRKPEFRSGFDGATDYVWQGKTYVVRHHQSNLSRDPAETSRLVGCIFCYSKSDEFPPEEFAQHFPGYARARYAPTGEKYEVKWTGGVLLVDRCKWEFETEPRQEMTRLGLRAVAYREELEAVEMKPLNDVLVTA